MSGTPISSIIIPYPGEADFLIFRDECPTLFSSVVSPMFEHVRTACLAILKKLQLKGSHNRAQLASCLNRNTHFPCWKQLFSGMSPDLIISHHKIVLVLKQEGEITQPFRARHILAFAPRA